MATSYSTVFSRFLNKIEDYEILEEMNANITFVDALLIAFLDSAVPKFTYLSNNRSVRDNTSKQFDEDLTELEQEILSHLMIVEYLSPKQQRSDLIEMHLGSKDFQSWSPANLLKEVRTLRESLKSEANSLMVEYYYKDGY